MLRAAVFILPLDMAECCRSCCGWFCRLCCCCCCRNNKETSPLLHTTSPVSGLESGVEGGVENSEMSKLQILSSNDGLSETQQLEVTVHSHQDDDDEEVIGSSNKVNRGSRETSVTSSRDGSINRKDPSTSTTFVRGSSGRSSWRMVPHSKRHSNNNEPTKEVAASQETEVSEVKVDLVATATKTPPPPVKEHRLTQTFDDDDDEVAGSSQGGSEDDVIIHTSSFSFTARDGKLIDSH